jgi:hypothetical protein
MRRCQVCGRPLKTGRKYCYACKGNNLYNRLEIKKRSDVAGDLYIWIVGAIIALAILYAIYVFLTILIATFIIPVICCIVLYFQIRKIKSSGFNSLSKKGKIALIITTALLIFSIVWWIIKIF